MIIQGNGEHSVYWEGDYERCKKMGQGTCDHNGALDFCYKHGAELVLLDDFTKAYFDAACKAQSGETSSNAQLVFKSSSKIYGKCHLYVKRFRYFL